VHFSKKKMKKKKKKQECCCPNHCFVLYIQKALRDLLGRSQVAKQNLVGGLSISQKLLSFSLLVVVDKAGRSTASPADRQTDKQDAS
jgi:hypothetical protein